MRKVKIGVIGAGTMGKSHIKTLQTINTCELVAVCDSQSTLDTLYSERLVPGSVRGFPDCKDFFTSGLCDAAAIVTPHTLHLDIAEKAFAAGLHVMCEKPITISVTEADHLISTWKKTSLKFCTMFTMRTAACNQIIKEWITGDRLGAIRRVEITCTEWLRSQKYYDSQPWRGTWKGEGGGLLMNQAPHNLDLLSWWFGPATAIEAGVFNRFHDIETEDEVSATIWTQAGFPIMFYANTAEAPGKDYIEIVADKGTLIRNNGKLLFRKLACGLDETVRHSNENFPVIKTEDIEIAIPENPRGHKVIFEDFFDTIINDRRNNAMIAPGAEGIFAVEWANAMLLSACTKKKISLPLDRSAYDDLLKKLQTGKIILKGNGFFKAAES